MTLTEWLNEQNGRTTKMAAHFGVTPGAVTQWAAKGVPVARMRAVRTYTKKRVTLEDMVPAQPASAEAA